MDRRRKFSIWADAFQRLLMANTLSGILPLFIVTEYPKSGGSWVGQMLADYLDLPFPRNRRVPLRSAVYHAHYLYMPFLKNVTCVMRDGRDVIVSYYFHTLFQNERNSPLLVKATRDHLRFGDYEDVRENLPRFIEYLFATEAASKRPTRFTWPRFVRSWIDKDVAIVKYEDLIDDPVPHLVRVLTKLTKQDIDVSRLGKVVRQNSFVSLSGRLPGIEEKGSFLRKALPGDWRKQFTQAAAEIFNERAGTELKMLGYERDDSWVNQIK